jgi:hypothetical protein
MTLLVKGKADVRHADTAQNELIADHKITSRRVESGTGRLHYRWR